MAERGSEEVRESISQEVKVNYKCLVFVWFVPSDKLFYQFTRMLFRRYIFDCLRQNSTVIWWDFRGAFPPDRKTIKTTPTWLAPVLSFPNRQLPISSAVMILSLVISSYLYMRGSERSQSRCGLFRETDDKLGGEQKIAKKATYNGNEWRGYEWNAILDRSFRGDIHSLFLPQSVKVMNEWTERMCESACVRELVRKWANKKVKEKGGNWGTKIEQMR